MKYYIFIYFLLIFSYFFLFFIYFFFTYFFLFFLIFYIFFLFFLIFSNFLYIFLIFIYFSYFSGFTNFTLSCSNPPRNHETAKTDIFEVDFQIKSDIGFQNAGNYEPMLQKLHMNELSTLNPKSNKLVYQRLKFNYEK